jgi:hypothetical protein
LRCSFLASTPRIPGSNLPKSLPCGMMAVNCWFWMDRTSVIASDTEWRSRCFSAQTVRDGTINRREAPISGQYAIREATNQPKNRCPRDGFHGMAGWMVLLPRRFRREMWIPGTEHVTICFVWFRSTTGLLDAIVIRFESPDDQWWDLKMNQQSPEPASGDT